MDLNSKFFYHLDFPELPKKYIEEAKNAEYSLIMNPTLYLGPSSFNETSFFNMLQNKFGKCYVNYTLNPPNSSYEWHVDMQRYVTINWIIKTNSEARTFFKEPLTNKNWNGIKTQNISNIIELYDEYLSSFVESDKIKFTSSPLSVEEFIDVNLDETEKDSIIWRLTELKYNSNKPTILNVTHPHCVYNNWPEERIILSLSLLEPTTYEEVVEFLKDQKINEY